MSDEKFIEFLREHESDDPARLLLSAGRWPEIDVPRAVRAIEARRKVREKIPSWYAHPELDYPSTLSLEQCSNEETARYKQAFVPAGARVADLTGGLGVDSWALRQQAAELHYCERQPALCAAARHNFAALGADITVHEGDGLAWLQKSEAPFDLIYLDPARRDAAAKRVYDIADCEPNLLEVKALLLSHAPRVLAKLSPMADIHRTLAQLPETRELHVVGAGGEVKELLVLLETRTGGSGAPQIIAADGALRFAFTPEQETNADVRYATKLGAFLLQPAKVLRKAGAFRLLSARYGVAKLAPSTHLYTADAPVPDFPGKCLAVEEVLPWGNAARRTLARRFDRLELAALNFPMSTDELRKRLGLPGGGDHMLFATTLNNEKILILCKL
jgi:16S rRNA G966 N2-methylase RsmD